MLDTEGHVGVEILVILELTHEIDADRVLLGVGRDQLREYLLNM